MLSLQAEKYHQKTGTDSRRELRDTLWWLSRSGSELARLGRREPGLISGVWMKGGGRGFTFVFSTASSSSLTTPTAFVEA